MTAISRESVERRLEELRTNMEEAERLERILEVWDTPAGRRPRGTSATAPSRSGRASRGSRPQEFLEAVKSVPGITASEIAQELDANPNYIYRLANDLKKEGKVVKREHGYYLPDSSPEPSGSDEDEPVDEMM